MLIFQAIETRFLGPTNHRGSRIKAMAQAGSLTVPYDHALSQEANHTAAAKAFAEKLGWVGERYGELIGGGNAKGDGNVYVLSGPTPECSCTQCDCDDRSWHGDEHDTACPLEGPRDA